MQLSPRSGRQRRMLLAVARYAGSDGFYLRLSWGLRPRLYAFARYAGSDGFILRLSWGLRPRLYASCRYAGSVPRTTIVRGAGSRLRLETSIALIRTFLSGLKARSLRSRRQHKAWGASPRI